MHVGHDKPSHNGSEDYNSGNLDGNPITVKVLFFKSFYFVILQFFMRFKSHNFVDKVFIHFQKFKHFARN